MEFLSLTRGRGIGANSYLLDLDGTRVVLDAGMHPREEGSASLPEFSRIGDGQVEAIFVSHSHLDHIGALPLAMRKFPHAPVYMTEGTAELGAAMLHNSVNVMTAKREELGISDYPFFTHRELDLLERVWECRALERPFTVGGMTCRFHDAGHIMGSVGLHLEIPGHSVFYTGDVNFEDQSVSRSAAFPRDHIDTLVLEATRGAVERPSGFSRQGEIERLGEWIRRVLGRGGSVLIPVFAVGKTQEILVSLHGLRQRGRIPSCPVFIGGLSTKMTSIVDRFADRVPRQESGLRILDAMDLQVTSRRRGGELRYSAGCVYALSSGMMSENTVSNRFALQFLDNPLNAVLFVGYTDPESPAGLIRRACQGDLLRLDPREEPVALQCDVETFDFSGHATREDLVLFAREVEPSKILLVHGDDDAVEWLRTTLMRELPQAEVWAPEPGESVSLG